MSEAARAAWEAAYQAFETPAAEQRKFRRRLVALGQAEWPRSARVVELFCGRGGGLATLSTLGFTHLEGVDLAPTLLARYLGPARTYLADCRALPFPDASKDVVIIQGGLHHLETLPGDLDAVLAQVRRVLVPAGRLVVVEPWDTPFLRGVHAATRSRTLRALYPKLDALATMIEHEHATYFAWLARPEDILRSFHAAFAVARLRVGWGKLNAVLIRR